MSRQSWQEEIDIYKSNTARIQDKINQRRQKVRQIRKIKEIFVRIRIEGKEIILRVE